MPAKRKPIVRTGNPHTSPAGTVVPPRAASGLWLYPEAVAVLAEQRQEIGSVDQRKRLVRGPFVRIPPKVTCGHEDASVCAFVQHGAVKFAHSSYVNGVGIALRLHHKLSAVQRV